MDIEKLTPAPWFESHGKLCRNGDLGGVSPVTLDKNHREFIALARNAFAGDPEALAWWEANRANIEAAPSASAQSERS